VSSAASDDRDDGIEYLHQKQKLSGSISLSDEVKTAYKSPRTAYRWAQLKDEERAYRNDNDCNTSESGTHTNLGVIEDDSRTGRNVQPGASRSALALWKLRDKVASGTYVSQEERSKNWREKISHLDPGVQFDEANPRKVFHSRCSTWLLVKEPGDMTRFKRHVEACQVMPIPKGGTLMEMGWLKKKNVEASGVRKSEAKMPCRGVSDMNNPLIDRYLKRTGAGGGGGRSIHVISRERFNEEFKYLTATQKEVVQVAQRTEWAWRNDHLNLRVYVMNCERFTSSSSLALSLCEKCKHLLILNVFTHAIRKKMPLDENLKYTNAQYINPTLGHLYAKVKGLRAIIEHEVSSTRLF